MQKSSGQDRLDDADLRAAEELTNAYHKMTRELERVIIGQPAVLKEILIALFSRGHCLLEGVPGLAKTLIVSTIAEAVAARTAYEDVLRHAFSGPLPHERNEALRNRVAHIAGPPPTTGPYIHSSRLR